MIKRAYWQGFSDECRRRGVNPRVLVKMATFPSMFDPPPPVKEGVKWLPAVWPAIKPFLGSIAGAAKTTLGAVTGVPGAVAGTTLAGLAGGDLLDRGIGHLMDNPTVQDPTSLRFSVPSGYSTSGYDLGRWANFKNWFNRTADKSLTTRWGARNWQGWNKRPPSKRRLGRNLPKDLSKVDRKAILKDRRDNWREMQEIARRSIKDHQKHLSRQGLDGNIHSRNPSIME